MHSVNIPRSVGYGTGSEATRALLMDAPLSLSKGDTAHSDRLSRH
jgi:hypothetical protein